MTHYELVQSNKNKSFLIILLFTTFITLASYIMAVGFGYGLDMVGIAFIVSGFMSFGSYYFSDKIILTISGARPATKAEYFDLFTVTENLSLSQRLPMPKVYVIEDTAPNAFATGRNPENAVICVTTGLMQKLTRSELEAVVAHELGHIKNYDILLLSLVTILVGFVTLLSDWMLRMNFGKKRDKEEGQLQMIFFIVGLVLALLTPFIAELIKLAISRRREFLADASAVAMTKNPAGLIKALTKLTEDQEPLEAANKATAHMYIVSPFKDSKESTFSFNNLFSTHPPLKERIETLKKL